jgi:ech hydrogenase subunit F
MFDMTATVLRNFLSKTHTRLYPFQVRETFENVRGNLDIRIEECIMCGMCQKKCPSQCITVNKDAKTWEVDPYSCVYCAICVDHCPVNCLFMRSEYRKPAKVKESNRQLQLKGPEKKKKSQE